MCTGTVYVFKTLVQLNYQYCVICITYLVCFVHNSVLTVKLVRLSLVY